MFLVLAALAALSFSSGGYFMKLSRGLTVLPPTIVVFALFGIGAAFQSLAMRHEAMTVTYIVVLGLEAVSAYLIGTFVLEEGSSALRLGGVLLVVAGIALLRAGE